VLGWLFKNKNHEKIKSELLVFLTPRILGTLDSNPALHSKAESTDGGGAL
jgi:type II secretory pathway component GspD/PulD (secretin)